MLTSLLLLVTTLVGGSVSHHLPWEHYMIQKPTIVERADWGARPPKSYQVMANPVSYVVIHHTFLPGACTTDADCVSSVKYVQDYHMDTRGWADIGYSFLVGGDDRAYEGRGWSKVGAHAIGYNRDSIGIAVIGDWTDNLPPEAQLRVVQNLIAYGVELGKITPAYKLIGHRQAANTTECPGARLYREIQTWPRWHYLDYYNYVRNITSGRWPPLIAAQMRAPLTILFACYFSNFLYAVLRPVRPYSATKKLSNM